MLKKSNNYKSNALQLPQGNYELRLKLVHLTIFGLVAISLIYNGEPFIICSDAFMMHGEEMHLVCHARSLFVLIAYAET